MKPTHADSILTIEQWPATARGWSTAGARWIEKGEPVAGLWRATYGPHEAGSDCPIMATALVLGRAMGETLAFVLGSPSLTEGEKA